MKSIILIALLLCSQLALAKDGQVNLLSPLPLAHELQSIEAELGGLLPKSYRDKAKDMRLIGKSKTTESDGKQLTQFGWVAIEKDNPRKKGGKEVVLLKKPAVGAVMSSDIHQILPNDKIPLQYEEEALVSAFEDLLAGRNLATEKQTVRAGNPVGTGKGLTHENLAAKRLDRNNVQPINEAGELSSDGTEGGQGFYRDPKTGEIKAISSGVGASSMPGTLPQFGGATTDGKSNSLQGAPKSHSTLGGGSYSGPNSVAGGVGSSQNRGQAGSHTSQSDIGGQGRHIVGTTGSHEQNRDNPGKKDNEPKNPLLGSGDKQDSGKKDKTGENPLLGKGDKQDPAVKDKANENLLLGADKRQKILDPKLLGGDGQNPLLGPEEGRDKRVNDRVNQGPNLRDVRAPNLGNENGEELLEEVRSTAQGCFPRIDRAQNKVVIQEKSVTYRGGNLIKEGQCFDTFDQYEIHRDYLCEDCGVHLDNIRKLAFDKYKAYWINDRGQKQVLDAEPKIDIENPHPFIDEPSTCQYVTEFNKAYPQVETVFYDRFNARRISTACHRQPEAVGLDLQTVACDLEHDMVLNVSFKRQRKYFMDVNGLEHHIKACEQSGQPIAHEFVTSECPVVVHPVTGEHSPMARRRINVGGRKQFISECEPLADTNLESTTEGCERNLFTHDLEAKKTYFNKRYFMVGPNDTRQYCTDCIRSSDMVGHQRADKGYEHDDRNHVSYKKKEVFIEFALLGIPQRIQVREPIVEPNELAVPHQLTQVRNDRDALLRYEGCFPVYASKITHDYKRPDQSAYAFVAGAGDPVTGENGCTLEIKYRAVYKGGQSSGFGGFEDILRFEVHKVTIQKFPGGAPSQEVDSALEFEIRSGGFNGLHKTYRAQHRFSNVGMRTFSFYTGGVDQTRWVTIE